MAAAALEMSDFSPMDEIIASASLITQHDASSRTAEKVVDRCSGNPDYAKITSRGAIAAGFQAQLLIMHIMFNYERAMNRSATELIQNLKPVGGGPSSKT